MARTNKCGIIEQYLKGMLVQRLLEAEARVKVPTNNIIVMSQKYNLASVPQRLYLATDLENIQ